MIRLTFCLVRLPHLTRPAFQAYWRDTHGPLVRSVAGILRIRRYVQLHAFAPETNESIARARGITADYDGVAELWWDSFDDLAATAGNPGAAAAGRMLLDDERRFIDLPKCALFWGDETVIVG
jgi:uncharacterized protein (TIGR02118 family)